MEVPNMLAKYYTTQRLWNLQRKISALQVLDQLSPP